MKRLPILAIQGAILILSGCSLTTWHPKRFDSITEVYPSSVDAGQFTEAPETSRTSSTFDAP